jgi:flagellar L-ring protein precursor FlgH
MKRSRNILAKAALVGVFSLMLFSQVFADSLWVEDESTSPYSTEKNFKVGDVITVIVSENTSAVSSAGTKTDANPELGLSVTHTIDKLASLIGKNTQLNAKGDNKYSGSGSSTRSQRVTTIISCRVVEVLDNGNIKIAGIHSVSVNDEEQHITVVGVIRSKDVAMDNSIISAKVAQAQVSVKGKGVIQEAETPGWFSRFFNWIF